MSFDLTVRPKAGGNNAADAKRAALQALKASVQSAQSAAFTYIAPEKCADRTRIVFDDSGSMRNQIENAKQGVVEYLKNCIPNQTAVAIHFMNTTAWSTTLCSDLPQLGADVLEAQLTMRGTPFFNTLKKALEASSTTRVVAFTDGAPTDQLKAEEGEEAKIQYSWAGQDSWIASAKICICIARAIGEASPSKKCIPIDTVYFGTGDEHTRRNRELLQFLSKETGGYFLHFDPAKVNFRSAFKYLAPVNRLQLASESFRADIESGRKS